MTLGADATNLGSASTALGHATNTTAVYSVALGAASEAIDDFVESTNATINGVEDIKNFAAVLANLYRWWLRRS